MTKIRVHELSKELGIQSKDLMIILNDMGANVKNHMSTVEDEYLAQLRSTFFTGTEHKAGKPAVQPTPKPSMPPAESKPVVAAAPRMEAAKPAGTPVASKPPATGQPVRPVQPGQTAPPPQRPGQPMAPRPTVPGQAQAPRPAQQGQPGQRPPMNQQGMAPRPPQQPRPDGNMGAPNSQNAGPRPQGQGPYNQNAGPRPQGQGPYNQNAGPRPQGQGPYNQNAGPRPQGQGPYNQNAGPRPQGQGPYNQNAGPRPQGQGPYNQNAGPRPQGQGPYNQNAGAGGPSGPRPAQPSYQQRPPMNNNNNNRPSQPQTGARPGAQGGRPNNSAGGNRYGGGNHGGNARRDGGGVNSHGRSNYRGPEPTPRVPRPLTNVKACQIPASITVKDFALTMEVAAGEVIKKLMQLGVMATINQEIDLDTAVLVGHELGVEVSAAPTQEEVLQVEEIKDNPEDLHPRWPVVTIMGHVDHGKTSLLDVIRQTNVTAQEAGGITQHIGAYQVEIKDKKITFLDTPGHEAFTAMRARGAQVTDIAILVVAADDGVMPQTVEAIHHAKAAGVPIIVAINKMDKPGANPDRVKQELTEYELVTEEWGGETICVPVSAKTKDGIPHLLEMILLVAEMKDLKANPNRSAKGTVIEALLDKGHGPVATVLVQTGTLQLGDSVIVGSAFGKVRALISDKGKRVKKAGPSVPVEIIGLDILPEAGDTFYAVDDDRVARQLATKRQQYKRETELKKNQKVTLDDLFDRIKEGEIKELKIVLKADVQGSIEAIRQSLERLSSDEVRVKVIHWGVGAIGENDIVLASASDAIIIGFNVRPDPMAKRTMDRENVDIRLYRVIYNAIEDVQKAMEGMLAPQYKEVIVGRAEVRTPFKVPKAGTIAGSYVIDGKITRNGEARILRDNVVVFEGKIDSLRRFKDDVREVATGFECGIGLERYNDIKEGDIIEVFTMEEVKRT